VASGSQASRLSLLAGVGIALVSFVVASEYGVTRASHLRTVGVLFALLGPVAILLAPAIVFAKSKVPLGYAAALLYLLTAVETVVFYAAQGTWLDPVSVLLWTLLTGTIMIVPILLPVMFVVRSRSRQRD